MIQPNVYSKLTVKHILDRKGYDVWSVAPNNSVFEALQMMAEKNVGALVVMRGDELVGIFSERDYARKLILAGKSSANTQVREVMTSQVIGVELHHEIEACLALMTGKYIRHLPVVGAEKKIVGVISIGDVVKEMLSEKEFVIEQMVNYITAAVPRR